LVDPGRKVEIVVGGQGAESACDERVVREAGHLALLGSPDFDPVGERNSLVDREQLVPAVASALPYDQREVDFCGGNAALHCSASLSATNSPGASSSARVVGGRPIVASAAAASSREVR